MFSPLSAWPMPLSPPPDFFAPGKSSGNCHHHCAGWQMSPKERVKRTTHYKAFLGLDQERGSGGCEMMVQAKSSTASPGIEERGLPGPSDGKGSDTEPGALDHFSPCCTFPWALRWSPRVGGSSLWPVHSFRAREGESMEEAKKEGLRTVSPEGRAEQGWHRPNPDGKQTQGQLNTGTPFCPLWMFRHTASLK